MCVVMKGRVDAEKMNQKQWCQTTEPAPLKPVGTSKVEAILQINAVLNVLRNGTSDFVSKSKQHLLGMLRSHKHFCVEYK